MHGWLSGGAVGTFWDLDPTPVTERLHTARDAMQPWKPSGIFDSRLSTIRELTVGGASDTTAENSPLIVGGPSNTPAENTCVEPTRKECRAYCPISRNAGSNSQLGRL
jgi:hypothetical protein